MNLNSTLGAAYTLKGALPQGMKEPKPPKAPTMSKKPGMPEFPEGDSGHPDGSAIQSGPDNEPTPSVGSARWVNIAAIGVVIGARHALQTFDLGCFQGLSEQLLNRWLVV